MKLDMKGLFYTTIFFHHFIAGKDCFACLYSSGKLLFFCSLIINAFFIFLFCIFAFEISKCKQFAAEKNYISADAVWLLYLQVIPTWN